MLLLAFWIFIFSSFYDGAKSKEMFNSHELPSWLTDNPAFQNYVEINSLESGKGVIQSNLTENLGWVVTLNNEDGYGVDIVLEKLSFESETENYLLLAAWPISTSQFKELKVLTGKFEESQTIRILNTKKFFVLFDALNSNILPQLVLNYTRYGSAYKKKVPPPDDPIRKETLFEVYLKGRNSSDYSDIHFLKALKEAIRKEAEAYCLAKNIVFNSSIPTEEMVLFQRISYCPFDWPDRDICVSLKHSVFVSGIKVPDEQIILDYQLTADKLKDMWMQSELPEMEKLNLYIFKLPETSSVALWWLLITGIAIITSLIMIFVLWKTTNLSRAIRKPTLKINNFEDVIVRQKPRIKLSKHQQIPAFLLKRDSDKTFAKEESIFKSAKFDNFVNEKSSGNDTTLEPPIKSFFGSLMFSTNKAFEDDENIEYQSTKNA